MSSGGVSKHKVNIALKAFKNSRYFCSKDGHVFSNINQCNPGGKMSPSLHKVGYYQVGIYDGKSYYYYVHQLVYLYFHGGYTGEINHIDGNKLNNNILNLEAVTPSENAYHAYRIGLRKRKFDNKLISTIRELRRQGKSRRELADKFSLNMEQVKNIVRRSAYGGDIN